MQSKQAMKMIASIALLGGVATPASLLLTEGHASAAAPAAAPSVPPPTGTSCSGIPVVDADRTCVGVTGTGYYIKYMTGHVTRYSGPTNGHIELYGPFGLIKNSHTGNLTNTFTSYYVTWSPYSTESGGTYCARLWLNLGGGHYTDAESTCVHVS